MAGRRSGRIVITQPAGVQGAIRLPGQPLADRAALRHDYEWTRRIAGTAAFQEALDRYVPVSWAALDQACQLEAATVATTNGQRAVVQRAQDYVARLRAITSQFSLDPDYGPPTLHGLVYANLGSSEPLGFACADPQPLLPVAKLELVGVPPLRLFSNTRRNDILLVLDKGAPPAYRADAKRFVRDHWETEIQPILAETPGWSERDRAPQEAAIEANVGYVWDRLVGKMTLDAIYRAIPADAADAPATPEALGQRIHRTIPKIGLLATG